MFLILAIIFSYTIYSWAFDSGYARGEDHSDHDWQQEAVRRRHGVILRSKNFGNRFVWLDK